MAHLHNWVRGNNLIAAVWIFSLVRLLNILVQNAKYEGRESTRWSIIKTIENNTFLHPPIEKTGNTSKPKIGCLPRCKKFFLLDWYNLSSHSAPQSIMLNRSLMDRERQLVSILTRVRVSSLPQSCILLFYDPRAEKIQTISVEGLTALN